MEENLNHLVAEIGEDGLVVASDYPHGDFSREDNIRTAIMGRENVPLRLREKILSSNSQRLYGLSEDLASTAVGASTNASNR